MSSLGLAVAYIVIILSSSINTVGTLIMNIGHFRNAEGQIQGLTTDIAELYKNVIFLDDYNKLMNINSQIEGEVRGKNVIT